MIPVQLTISGLYSYTQPVTIDFQPLVEAKLFGIFGPVGSGKSTILEAIMFVLFDRTTRLNKAGDDRYYNMMNLQSNEMSIDFIFKGGRNHKNKYRFYFLARRSSKDFQKVEVKDRSYYQWTKNDWNPLKKPDVLGMTYENFMQTVIIPQGKFREFIDQKPTARTLMLKELFHLDRFDIASKAFQQLAVVKDQHSYLEGQLSQFEELSKTVLKQLSKEIEAITADIEKKSNQESKLSDETNQLQLLQHVHQELSEVSETVSILESEQQFYQQKQHQLNRFLRVKEIFQEPISRLRDLLEEAKTKQRELMEAIKVGNQLTKEVKIAKQRWETAQSEYATKDLQQQQIDDLKLLLEVKDIKEALEASLLKQEQLNQKISQLDTAVRALKIELEKAQSLEYSRQKALSELQVLTQLKGWWNVQLMNQKQLQALKEEISGTKKEVQALKQEKNKLQSERTDNNKLKSEIVQTRKKLHALLVQDDWRTHARHLKEGKPCPLCGSIEHPNPLSDTTVEPQIKTIRKQLETLEGLQERQRQLVEESNILTSKIDEKRKTLNSLDHKYHLIREEQTKHREIYPGKKIPREYPNHLAESISQIEKDIEASSKLADQLRSKQDQYQKLGKQREILLQELPTVLSEKEKLQGKIEQITSMIKVLDQQAFLKKTRNQLQSKAQQLKRTIEAIDLNYKHSFDQLARIEQGLNQQKGHLQSLEDQVAKIKDDVHRLESGLIRDCKKESLKGLKEVQKILALGLEVEVERQELEKFNTDLKAARIRQQALRKKMGRRKYQAEKHRQMNIQLEAVKVELKQQNHNLSNKKFTLEQYQTRIKKKDSLQKALKELTIRKNNVQEICNLLRGNGFINFISSVYLQNLCRAANQRFSKLTGNRLSLELNTQNEFMVRDHLNDGKLRLLKTLSGGQIFQASFSLALSLAENVKNLNQAEQSFFFLDEGFGSLDRISLQLVFESLKTLQNENRIVGVISHVEDLQMEIATYLQVKQDPEKGSIISCSWTTS